MSAVTASGSQTPTVLEQERQRCWWWQSTTERGRERPSFGETAYFAFLLFFFLFSISSDEGKRKKKQDKTISLPDSLFFFLFLCLYLPLPLSPVRYCRVELVSDGDQYSESKEEWVKNLFCLL